MRLTVAMVLIALTGGAVPASVLSAQQLPLETGTRIRVTAPEISPPRFVAEYRGVRTDTLHLAADPVLPQAVPLQAVLRLEARQPRSAGAGALRGAGYGFAVPMALALVVSPFEPATAIGFGWLAVTFGPAGGAVWGAVRPGTRWQPIPLPEAWDR